MLNYETLKNKAREFLAATGLRVEEFQKLLPAFEAAYEKCYPRHQTLEGKPRRRRAGGGAKGLLTSLDFHSGKSPNDSGPKHRIFPGKCDTFVNPDYTDGEVCLTVTCYRRRSIAEQFRDLTERSLLHVRSSLGPQT